MSALQSTGYSGYGIHWHPFVEKAQFELWGNVEEGLRPFVYFVDLTVVDVTLSNTGEIVLDLQTLLVRVWLIMI